MNPFTGIPAFWNLIHSVTDLFRLTEEDRIQAGIFLGREGPIIDSERHTFPGFIGEDPSIRVGQEGRGL